MSAPFTPNPNQTFDKKIYTAGLMARDIRFLVLKSPEIIMEGSR